METKDDIIAEVCDSIGIHVYPTLRGSTVPKAFFEDIAGYFGLGTEGSAIEVARRICDAAGMPWEPNFDSTLSPSGGGGTVTVSGISAIRDAVNLLLDEEDGQDDFKPTPENESAVRWTLNPGDKIKRSELHDRFGGIRQGGIAPSRQTPNIFLFTDSKSNMEHGYEQDYWINDTDFAYCGQGQRGDQKMSGPNAQILRHKEDHRALRLFQGVRQIVEYVGEFELYEEQPFQIVSGIGRDGNPREVAMFRLQVVGGRPQTDLPPAGNQVGIEYLFASEDLKDIAQALPFTYDPDLLDRATRTHSMTQNAIARWLNSNGLTPLSPNRSDPPFDIAWLCGGRLFVAEVKSIHDFNEVHQIRLGIGQVLDYASQLNAIPVLVTSRPPIDRRFVDVAVRERISLTWPEQLANLNPFSSPTFNLRGLFDIN